MSTAKAFMALPGWNEAQLQSLDDSITADVRHLEDWRTAVCIPLLAVSLISFLATILAFSYAPDIISRTVFGSINVAYLLALTQFLITFLVAVIYSLSARKSADPARERICKTLEQFAGDKNA